MSVCVVFFFPSLQGFLSFTSTFATKGVFLGFPPPPKKNLYSFLSSPPSNHFLPLSHISRPHTLPPTTLYLAHLAPYLASTHTQLVGQIASTQTENEALARRIDAQRNEAGDLLEGLERVMRDLEGANGVLGEYVGEVGRAGGAEERGELGKK